jgi:hypothetical protein
LSSLAAETVSTVTPATPLNLTIRQPGLANATLTAIALDHAADFLTLGQARAGQDGTVELSLERLPGLPTQPEAEAQPPIRILFRKIY